MTDQPTGRSLPGKSLPGKSLRGKPLRSEPRFARPDDLYQLLIDAHRDLTPEQSQAFNSRLILLLANHIGDEGVIAEAIEAAGKGL